MAKVDFEFTQILQTPGISSHILTTQTRQDGVTFENEHLRFKTIEWKDRLQTISLNLIIEFIIIIGLVFILTCNKSIRAHKYNYLQICLYLNKVSNCLIYASMQKSNFVMNPSTIMDRFCNIKFDYMINKLIVDIVNL